jgi:hypothetical protein
LSTKDQLQSNNLTALRQETAALLDRNGIYSALGYGWENEDTPNDDYVGLAMWTSDAPFKPRWDIWDQTSPPSKPSPRDEAFYKAGEDFFGTMELARNALGVALYSYEHRQTENLMDDDESFWEHTAIASVWLNIAADRIRDYFLAARFGTTAKEYKKSRGRNDFLRPFLELDPDETANAKTAWDELQVDARNLENRRTVRNQIVHNVTSRQGKHAVDAIRRQREESRGQSYWRRIQR